jgi:hypothetical protein
VRGPTQEVARSPAQGKPVPVVPATMSSRGEAAQVLERSREGGEVASTSARRRARVILWMQGLSRDNAPTPGLTRAF